MKEINLYSPVDGEIKDIADCLDAAFAEKMLGDGVVIIPEAKSFYSPFEKGVIEMIFETKHAIFVKDQNSYLTVLMHIGLDTVVLKGDPFDVKVKEKQIINSDEVIVEVDLDKIKESSLSIETPIVFDTEQNKNFKFEKKFKKGKIKKGDLIGTFVSVLNKNIEENINNLEFKNKYEGIAEEIYKLVGTKTNYSDVYNCMTRLRFNIVDKNAVKVEEILKIPIVKGVNWAGSELQVVIGGEVYKVNDEIQKLVVEKKQTGPKIEPVKKTFKQRALGAVNGVIIPTIPVILVAGLLMGIKAILIQSGLIVKINNFSQVQESDIASGLIHIISELGLGFLGVFFSINTVKYLGGNIVMGLFIGLTLASPYLIWGVSWELFTIGSFEVRLGGYFSAILPHVCAGIVYFYFDRWVKTWMPSAVDVVLRNLLSFVFTVLAIFLVLGPILGLLEQFIGVGVNWVGRTPYGIGAIVFALLWQPLVLTGMHVAVITTIINTLNQTGEPSSLYGAGIFPVWGQMGAVIAIAILTKNRNVKQIAFGTIPGALFGVTEPMIYGITLPRLWPFIMGCVGAGIGAGIVNLFGFAAYVPGGMGILAFTRVMPGGIKMIILMVIGMVIAFGSSLLLTLLVSKERVDEKKTINNISKKIIKYSEKEYPALFTETLKEELLLKIADINKLFTKEKQVLIKTYEKKIALINNLEAVKADCVAKDNFKKEKIFKKYENFKKKDDLENTKKYFDLFKNFKESNKIEDLDKKIQNLYLEKEKLSKEFISLQDELADKCEDYIKFVDNKFDSVVFEKVKNNYFNAIHSVDICFNLTDPLKDTFKFKVAKNKKLIRK